MTVFFSSCRCRYSQQRREVLLVIDGVSLVKADDGLFVELLPVGEGNGGMRGELEAGRREQGVVGDLLGRRVILLEQRRRHRQRFAGVVEPFAGRWIDGKCLSRANVRPGQVANGVVVFGVGESPRRHDAGIAGALHGFTFQHGRDRLQHLGPFSGRWLLRVLRRRHLLLLHERLHVFPLPEILGGFRGRSKPRQIEVALGLPRVVAAGAVLLQEGNDRLLKRLDRLAAGHRNAERDQRGQARKETPSHGHRTPRKQCGKSNGKRDQAGTGGDRLCVG